MRAPDRGYARLSGRRRARRHLIQNGVTVIDIPSTSSRGPRRPGSWRPDDPATPTAPSDEADTRALCVCWPTREPEGTTGRLRRREPARARSVTLLRRALREWLDDEGVDEDTTENILLAVGEAVTNAAEHACPERDCAVELLAGPRVCGPGIAVMVNDDGAWRPPPGDPGWRGRGMQLMDRLARRASIESGADGTTVRLCWPDPDDPTHDGSDPGAGTDPGSPGDR